MFKCKLQELCHRHSWTLPEYTTMKEGQDHNPLFQATVMVGDLNFATTDHYRSSKEAQNGAAKLAFQYFSSNTDVCDSIAHQQQQQPLTNSSPSHFPISPSSEMLHLYKNQLQNYAQKKNLMLPQYSYDINGPHHARRFKSSVTFDGKTYETSEFYTTVKEAEHAAAKVAFESLTLNEIPEDEGLFKNLLQQRAQRDNLGHPIYETIRKGLPHTPTFVSTVKIGGKVFHGQEAKTKKQAEMSSAKAAYYSLRQCPKSTVDSIGFHVKEALKVSSSTEHLIETEDGQRSVKQSTPIAIYDEHDAERKESEKNVQRYRSSCLGIVDPLQQNPFPFSSSAPEGCLSSSSSLNYFPDSVIKSDVETPVAASTITCKKILVYPRKSNVPLPDGVTILPSSDDKWLAVTVEYNPNK